MDNYKPKHPDQLLTLEDVCWLLAIGKPESRRLQQLGDFPKPITLGKYVRWAKKDVDAYVERKRREVLLQGLHQFNPNVLSQPAERAENIPATLAGIAGALSEYRGFAHPPCVYFLVSEGVVVYVGKTGQLGSRVGQHLKGDKKTPPKEFDRVLYLFPAEGQLDAAEFYYIKTLSPLYNQVGIDPGG